MPISAQLSTSMRALSEQRQSLQDAKEQAVGAFRQSLRCDLLLTELAEIVDHSLNELLALYPLPAKAALLAVGGYGRGELYPHSDVDLLILLEHPATEAEALQISELLTAMWDLGLEPGHSVRTIAECLEEATKDITVETALLESRYLAGNPTLARAFERAIQAQLDKHAFFRAKLLEMRQRHNKFDNTPFALEPNCKESPGGLRDLQVILWMARAAGYGNNWAEIGKQGLLTNDEVRYLRRAELAFQRLRIELHLHAGRREDRLLFDVQPALAKVYGFAASGPRRPSELLMQRYYWAAKRVTQLNTLLIQNLQERLFERSDELAEEIDQDFYRLHDLLHTVREDAFDRKPTLILRAFLVLQQHASLKGMSAPMLRALWHARTHIDKHFRHNPVNRHAFLSILQQPRGIVHALRQMNDLGILPRYLPPFRRIVGQMQHDLFHAYTVDQHILNVIRNLRRFTMAEHAHEYPFCTQLMADFDQPWLLYVAALFHDIAKGRGGDHSTLGADEVRQFAADHGMSVEDTDLVEFLVREHLTMSMAAQKKDLSDPEVVLHFAQHIGSTRRLVALYLLTVADIRGTSPKVWNAWKARLLEELFYKAQAVLGGDAPDSKAMLDKRKKEALAELRLFGVEENAHQRLWSTLGLSYFLRHEAAEIAWHTRHLYNKVDTETPIVKARNHPHGEGIQVVVYTPDAPDLFTRICGYFEQRCLSILDAHIHTTKNHRALDTFMVLSDKSMKEQRPFLNLIEHELIGLLAAPAAPEIQRACIGPSRSRQSRAFPIRPSIELRSDEKGEHWILNITAGDRPGVLHAVAQVFVKHGINLRTAKVMTLGERIEDSFLIDGLKLNDARGQLDFERDLMAALQ
ncbi:MAG: [protein-PII] uridylyltransferase [Pigmentiphaga sp.]